MCSADPPWIMKKIMILKHITIILLLVSSYANIVSIEYIIDSTHMYNKVILFVCVICIIASSYVYTVVIVQVYVHM